MNTETKTHAVLSDEERVEIFLKSLEPKSGLIDDPNHIAFGVAPIDHDESDYENEISYNRYSEHQSENDRKLELRRKWYLEKTENIIRHLDDLREDNVLKLSRIIDAGKLNDLLDKYDFDPDRGLLAKKETDFPAHPKLPPAGETYGSRQNKKEDAPSFIGRVYGQWLTGEFTRADLRKVDPQAVQGLINWERIHGRAELNLPTVKERNDRQLADGATRENIKTDPHARLRSALWRRERQ